MWSLVGATVWGCLGCIVSLEQGQHWMWAWSIWSLNLFPIYFLLSRVVQDVGFWFLALTTMPAACLPPSWTSSLLELYVQIDSFFCNLLFCSWCFIAESEKKPMQMLKFTHFFSYYTSWSQTDRNNRELFVRNLISDILHRIFYSSGAWKVDSAI